ncbi:acyltransferase family protein [Gephyromycinifex aptenodytis]|uniref:acyltransferase family protein n=1 Tax=Gephyromycinifex aptenodytis TaxID=2716227 RepID=UPI001445587C|nr:acyltransferase [Gephyromycinifex aptenodytis]
MSADTAQPRTVHGSAHESTPATGNSLAQLFDPRANSLNNLRLILATLVAVVHASAISLGTQPVLGRTEVGSMAVDAFFVLSGFLVARSYDRIGSFIRYAWHRFLRIMPLFWIVLIVTAFVVAPAIAALEGQSPLSVFQGENASWHYVVENSLLYIAPQNFGVAGLPNGTATPHVVNGALWTLFYEVVCYVMVACLGVVGLLRRNRWLVIALAGLFGAATITQEFTDIDLPAGLFLRFFWVFLLGTLAYLYQDRLPITWPWALVALGVVAASLAFLHDYRSLGGPAFAYLCMWAVVRTPWLRRNLRWDLSYGMYVFHWPIETMLVVSGVSAALGLIGYTILAVLLAASLAAVSWNVIESPALSKKNIPLPFDRTPGRR